MSIKKRSIINNIYDWKAQRLRMGKCPYCKQIIDLENVIKGVKGIGLFKQEIMYVCPHCQTIVGFSRGNYG
jgi:hypothetical protein